MARSGSLPVGRGLWYVAIAATAWGTAGVVAALLFRTSGLDSLSVSFWRFLGGTVALAAARIWHRCRRGPAAVPLSLHLRTVPIRLLVTGIGLAVYQTAYFAAVGLAGVAVATVVTLGSGPILVALGARAWMSERLGGRSVAIMSVSLAGLVLLVLGSGTNTGSAPVAGVGLALLSAVGYAGTTLLSRATSSGSAVADPSGSALIGFAIGSVCLLPFACVVGLLPTHGDRWLAVGLLGYLGLVPSALAYRLFFAGLTVVTATTAAVVALIEPLTAAVIAVTLLAERLTVLSCVGSVLLAGAVAALATAERGRRRTRRWWVRW